MVSEEGIRHVLVRCARLAVPVEQLDDDSDLYDAGMTSHASVAVMLGLENALDIEFPAELQRKSTFVSIARIRAVLTELGV